MFTFKSYTEAPEFMQQAHELGGELTPAFLLSDPVSTDLWPRLSIDYAEHQLAVIDETRQTAIGVVNSIPLPWSRPLSELPDEGWDWALANANASGNWQCALLAAILPEYRGRGLAEQALTAAKQLGRRFGHQGMLVPVRPTRKSEFVHMPMTEYLEKRKEDGTLFDPWIRLHLTLGAELLHVCQRAMSIKLTWDQWIEYGAEPSSEADELVIADGLVPIRRQADGTGLYVEPNVWMVHV